MSKTLLMPLTVKVPTEHLSVLKKAGKTSAWVRDAIEEKLAREAAPRTRSRTALGRKLLAARAEHARTGRPFLSLEQVRAEAARRRGER
jgi:hypothetical protein